jgi:trehalose 6-phosphate phosphatase
VEHLFDDWPDFAADVSAASHLLLLADYDGTLTPIVGRPVDATLPPGVRAKLSTLANRPTVSVGIISGRSLPDLRSLVAIGGIYYAGNHGLEIEGPGLSFVSPPAEKAKATIKDIAGRLATALEAVSGVIIEDKGLSLSLHYRLVKEEEVNTVKNTFRRLTSPLGKGGRIRVTTGKKVLEVRPPVDWHKGKAVEAITREIMAVKPGSMLTVYLGDDTTDEDAFKVVPRWSVFVGGDNPASNARYFLDSTVEVEELLSRLLELS